MDWHKIEISNIKGFRKNIHSIFMNDYVEVTLKMPTQIWRFLHNFICQGDTVRDRRRNDSSESFQVSKLTLDFINLLKRQKKVSTWKIEHNINKNEYSILVESIERNGLSSIKYDGKFDLITKELKKNIEKLKEKEEKEKCLKDQKLK